MEEALGSVIGNLEYYVLAFTRITALIILSPIFGRRNIPNIAKIGLCLALTYIVCSARGPLPDIEIRGVFEYALLLFKELLFGVVISYCTQVFFTLVQTAGHSIDMQMGFGMVNVFDVQNNISVPVTGNLYTVILTIMFFALNAHHQLILILMGTFDTVPVGQIALNANLGIAALEVFILSFVMAVNVSIPFIAAGMLAEITLGFVVRTTPQMNVFVVGIPLKVLLGLIMLLVIMPVYIRYCSTIFMNMFSSISYMLQGLAGSV